MSSSVTKRDLRTSAELREPGIAGAVATAAPIGGGTQRASADALRLPRIRLCGVPLDVASMRQTIACIVDRFERGFATSISVLNVAKLVNMRSDALLRESVLAGDLILADGAPLVWLSRIKGTPLPERVAGIDLMRELLRVADERRLRVYFLGATASVVQQTVIASCAEFPRLIVAGARDGYFSETDEAAVAEEICNSRPDILLVAMSSPKKEVFLKRWAATMAVPICHGVGGSFDVVAGVTRRAPLWMQRVGLEWFFRVLQEPRRMWKRYLITNTKFIVLALRDLLLPAQASEPFSR